MKQLSAIIQKYLTILNGKWTAVGKIALGIVILSLSTLYLYFRFPYTLAGQETQMDTAVLAITVIIILMPFLSEIELFGVKFKRELKELKNEFDGKILTLKSQIQLVQTQSQSISIEQKISITDPDRLQASREAIQQTVPLPPPSDNTRAFKMPDEIRLLLATSYNINKQLAELTSKLELYNSATNKKDHEKSLFVNPVSGKIDRIAYLLAHNVIDEEMSAAISQVLLICKLAREGEGIADIQYDFVKDTAPSLLSYLEEKLTDLNNKK